MANWCSNIIQFEANASTMQNLADLFTAMAAKEIKEGCGQLPSFIQTGDGYLFDIRWEDGVLYYATKWGPNPEVIQAIAAHFNIDGSHFFEESMMQVYGEITYTAGVVIVTALEPEDYELFSYDEETDMYHFEGETYESDSDILEILLARKKARK